MANAAAKNRLKANKARLRLLLGIILLCNLIYAVTHVGLKYQSFTRLHAVSWLLLLILQIGPFLFIKSVAAPTYAHGDLVDGGEDLSKHGVLEYAHDLLYLTAFVQIGCIFSAYFALLFIVVPLFAVYLAYTSWGSWPQTPGGNDLASEGLSRRERRQRKKKGGS